MVQRDALMGGRRRGDVEYGSSAGIAKPERDGMRTMHRLEIGIPLPCESVIGIRANGIGT